MKKWKIFVLFLVAILATTLAVWVGHEQQMKALAPQEREAMEYLPGFQILVNGERIVVKRRWTHESFLSQNWAIPYLESIMPRIQSFRWTRDRPPIEITESESTVTIVIPTWPPPPKNAETTGWWGWEYSFKGIFDKATGKIIWARRGG